MAAGSAARDVAGFLSSGNRDCLRADDDGLGSLPRSLLPRLNTGSQKTAVLLDSFGTEGGQELISCCRSAGAAGGGGFEFKGTGNAVERAVMGRNRAALKAGGGSG